VATDSTESLVTRAKAGSREAFDVLVESFEVRLRSAVQARIGPHLRHSVDVDDVLQETFTRAFQSLSRFEWKGENSFYNWLQGISENLILGAADRHKRRKSFELQRQDCPRRESQATASRAMRREERFDRLQKALEALSPDHREVVLLARIEGLQIKEIALRMGRSTSAVKNLLLRALKELKRSFGDTESFHLPDRSLKREGGGHDE